MNHSTTPASAPAQQIAAAQRPITQAATILRTVFGFTAYRPHQEEIVNAILAGRDVFAVMPTGGGKSLCFQLPAKCLPGTCVVISPLISLMKDQVDKARAVGIRAEYLNSSLTFDEQKRVIDILRGGQCDLLYVAPERFAMPGFRKLLGHVRISLFAIDEAHCISAWGHDFRPDYLNLSRIVHDFPNVPITAFTATATPRVQEQTIKRLGLRRPHIVRASFNRANLFYEVAAKQNVDFQILDFVRSRPDSSGIVYRTTRNDVMETAAMLQRAGISALPYHAGLDTEERRVHQDAFILGHCRVIVATIAFGMGIDKADVRYVVHGDLPGSVSGYYQETGRAGRDGKPARCLLLFDRRDMARHHHFIDKIEDDQLRSVAKNRLDEIIAYAGIRSCRRHWLLSYFGETPAQRRCGACAACRPDLACCSGPQYVPVHSRRSEAMAEVKDIVKGVTDSLAATLELARQGMNRLSIAQQRNLKPSTIAAHLEQLIRGGKLDIEPHVAPNRRTYIERLFARFGTAQLSPVVEAAQGKVSFDEARLVRAALQRRGTDPRPPVAATARTCNRGR